MKYRHYAPKAPVILLDGDIERCVAYIRSQKSKNGAYIAYSEDVAYIGKNLPDFKIYDFGQRNDHMHQAHSLFAILREADNEDFDVIYAPIPPRSGIGLALYNRMIRAAAHKIIRL